MRSIIFNGLILLTAIVIIFIALLKKYMGSIKEQDKYYSDHGIFATVGKLFKGHHGNSQERRMSNTYHLGVGNRPIRRQGMGNRYMDQQRMRGRYMDQQRMRNRYSGYGNLGMDPTEYQRSRNHVSNRQYPGDYHDNIQGF